MTNKEAITYNKNLREYMKITDKKSEYKFLKENYIALDMAIKALEQTRPKGKWHDKKMTIKGAHSLAYGRYGCSICKKKFPNKSNYCPNCGAEMEVEE